MFQCRTIGKSKSFSIGIVSIDAKDRTHQLVDSKRQDSEAIATPRNENGSIRMASSVWIWRVFDFWDCLQIMPALRLLFPRTQQ
jgi:hypothetical protein